MIIRTGRCSALWYLKLILIQEKGRHGYDGGYVVYRQILEMMEDGKAGTVDGTD